MITVSLIIISLAALFFVAAYISYFVAFGRDPKREAGFYDIPEGEQYEFYAPQMRANVDNVFNGNCEDVYITSRDGVKLYGRYYHHKDGAPLTILFHGYRSNAVRDVNGAYKVCKRNDWNILTVDQRAHGKSGGKTITFGLKERFDCIDWCNYAIDRFGKDIPITIMGVSMGAATVLMAAGTEELPYNVKGVAADCSYSDVKQIIGHVAELMHLPKGPAGWFVRLGGMIYGKFDINELSTMDLVKNIKIAALFIHGSADSLIPYRMSEEMHDNCKGEKKLIIVPGAEHGMSYFVDNKTYEESLTEFFRRTTHKE